MQLLQQNFNKDPVHCSDMTHLFPSVLRSCPRLSHCLHLSIVYISPFVPNLFPRLQIRSREADCGLAPRTNQGPADPPRNRTRSWKCSVTPRTDTHSSVIFDFHVCAGLNCCDEWPSSAGGHLISSQGNLAICSRSTSTAAS